MYLIAVWSNSSLGPFCWRVFKWLRNNLSTTRYDLTPADQGGKLYEKKFFTFDFHILPQHRCIGGKIFPCLCISIKTAIIHEVGVDPLLRIETVLKLLDCSRKSQNYVHIDAY